MATYLSHIQITEEMLHHHLIPLFPTLLPEVLQVNQNLLCFLMPDAGSPLRDHLRAHYQVELMSKGLVNYVTIQQKSVQHIHALLALGVPDWRLTNLPILYLQLLNETEFLMADGLTQTDIDKLKQLYPLVTKLCQQLAKYHIPETIEHGDFHDNNFLIDPNNRLVINDWGDAVITHPFFSLVSFLWSASRNHPSCDSKILNTLQESYLAGWLPYETKSKLRNAWKLANRLHRIKFALSFYRITQCPGMKDAGQYKGIITEALQAFLQSDE